MGFWGELTRVASHVSVVDVLTLFNPQFSIINRESTANQKTGNGKRADENPSLASSSVQFGRSVRLK